MDLLIAAVGRLRGAEADLCADYAARTGQTGRSLGLGPLRIEEVDDRRARDDTSQAARLIALSEGAFRVVLDERGVSLSSPDLAERIGGQRDGGTRRMAFLIGGADGHAQTTRAAADLTLSLGPMVWPHALVRVMVAEQLYRAVSILAGTPYHRE
ncbi:MAG: 23S rRNA (pseudouridine(1915)-N(3))-methyltransferase RlmH [Pseudomonadota bacterium]